MATSVELVQIRYLKKGQIIKHSKEHAKWILHFMLTKTKSNILPFIFSLELSIICVSPFTIFMMFHD